VPKALAVPTPVALGDTIGWKSWQKLIGHANFGRRECGFRPDTGGSPSGRDIQELPNSPIYSPRKGVFEPSHPFARSDLITAVQLCLGRRRRHCNFPWHCGGCMGISPARLAQLRARPRSYSTITFEGWSVVVRGPWTTTFKRPCFSNIQIPRQVLEELPVLDCRMLARRKMVPRDHSQRTYNLSLPIPAIRLLELMGKRTYARFIARLHKLEANTSRKRKPITKKLSYRVLRPITAYSSQRHAIV
jgi:hypothetical protein